MPEPISCRELQLARAGTPPRPVECTDRVPPVEKLLEQKCEEPRSQNYRRSVLRESQPCTADAPELPVGARICPEYKREPTSGHGNAERQEQHPQNRPKGGLQESQICPADAPELPVSARICPEYKSEPTSGHENAERQEQHPQNRAKRGPPESQICPPDAPELPVGARICPEYKSEPTSGHGIAECQESLSQNRPKRGPQESQICTADAPELPVGARICPAYKNEPTSGHGIAECQESLSQNRAKRGPQESQICTADAPELPVGAQICPEYKSEPTSGRGIAECQESLSQNRPKRGPQESQICPADAPELPVGARICPEYKSKPTSGHGIAECQESLSQNRAKRGPQESQICPPDAPELPVGARICPEYRSESTSGDGNAKLAGALRESRNLRPAPLGPIPLSGDYSASQQYWAPLADLTGSRPAVKKLSTTRYSPAEWRLRNDRVFKESHESVRDEMLAAFNAHRCMERIFAQTDKDQQNNNIRLSTRLGLVGRWKMEFQRQIAEFNSEVDAVQEERKRLMRSKHSLNLIESIDKDVKSVRCLRMETELVRDEVEDELSNELDLCADVNNVYTRCVDQVQTQLKELKDAKQRLEIDLTDKKEAWSIDVACRALTSTSPTLEWKAGSAKMPGDQSTPTSYEHHCKEALAMAETALQRSRILRSNLNDIHEKSVHDLRAQADRVEIALSKKIDETVEACRRIENELHECLKALSDAEALVDETRAATKRLDGAMKCAQTRLDLRSRRNKVENCRDVPHFGLVDEVKTLSEGVSAMLSQIKRATDSIDDLTKARKALEKDLVMKKKSLWVDRERCQLLRSFYPTVQALAGH